MEKRIAKIVWYTLSAITLTAVMAALLSLGSMIETAKASETCVTIFFVSIIWIIAHSAFVRYLNEK